MVTGVRRQHCHHSHDPVIEHEPRAPFSSRALGGQTGLATETRRVGVRWLDPAGWRRHGRTTSGRRDSWRLVRKCRFTSGTARVVHDNGERFS